MQMRTALSQEILVPWRKQVAENPKTALDLITTDQGGLVYQPILGVHSSVGAIDFISMYPGIMVRCNISPETVPHDVTETTDQPPGLVPQTLAPLLDKRVALKHRLARLPAWDPRRGPDQARSSAHKWLLVTCFGYLGYKNARFGQIEAHEAVTRYGREALLRAKEAAEDLGFAVLQMYVDGLWLQRPDATRPEDFEAVLNAVVQRTGLPVALDGVYRWVAFLPSRSDPRVPVPNRYFGAFQDGSLKVRGLAARRRDTPPFVAALQMELIEIFARAETAERLPACLPEARRCVQRRLAELAAGRVPPADLLVAQRLSRDLARYRTPSPAARAAAQLAGIGKEPRPGQRVRFLHLLGRPDVHAWDLPEPVDPRRIDLARYRDLALRAAREVIEGLGLRLETEEARSFSFRPLAGRPLLAERAMILLPRTKPAPPPEERS
jgi:DNA polymerase-2